MGWLKIIEINDCIIYICLIIVIDINEFGTGLKGA